MQRAINRAARTVLSVYKTTPVPALLCETGWGPAAAWLERIHDRIAVRVAAADPKHLLRRRWNSHHFQWIRRRKPLELSHNSQVLPWQEMDRIQVKKEIGAIERKESLLEYQKWVDSEKSGILDLIVYSDGSMNEFGNAGAGYCIFRGPTFEIASGRILLGRTAEVYDAEIIGATEGLKAAMAHFMGGYTANVTVFLDNEEAALRLHTGTMTSSSSKQISEFQELKNSWPNRNRTSVASPGTVRVRWIPGHRRIVGNGKADVLGKTACGEPTSRTQASVSRGKRLLEQRYGANIDDFWNKKAPERYKYLGIRMTGTMLDKLKFLSPKSLGSLLAARSAHGDFAAYHRRFKYEEAALMCESGEEKSPEHPFSCRRLSRRGKPQSKPSRGVVGDIR